jgi:hypothetical protein
MKKLVMFISSLILFACNGKNEIPKPDNLIEKPVMEDILYDLTLIQAIRGFKPEKFNENKIEPRTYIYQKYKIDSAQFYQSNLYYASNMEDYKIMFKNVAERLEKKKSNLDVIIKRKEKIKSKRISDSLIKISKDKDKIKAKKILDSLLKFSKSKDTLRLKKKRDSIMKTSKLKKRSKKEISKQSSKE